MTTRRPPTNERASATTLREIGWIAWGIGGLVEAGKAKMGGLDVCMRKPLMIAYGMTKRRCPFDPQWG